MGGLAVTDPGCLHFKSRGGVGGGWSGEEERCDG